MGLKYNILWVDDRKEEYEELGIDNDIREYVKSIFFDPCLDFCESVDDAINKISEKKFDVIFSDYNIDEKNGEDFIKNIRSKSVNTEILFYSAQKGLDLPKSGLNRITFLKLNSDTSYEQLKTSMISIIDLTVEKLNDLSNLRGLVMSEVSELDEKMENIVAKYYIEFESEEKRLSFNDHIVKNSEESLKKRLKKDGCNKDCVHSWRNESFDSIIPRMDSSQKARTIKLIIDEVNFEYSPRKNNFYEDFLEDVVNVRNDLAHCVSEEKNGKEILKTKKDPYVEFDREKITGIRKNLQKYSGIFNDITKSLK